MPNFASRENAHLLKSKKRKLNVQQSFQQILAQEVVTITNGDRVSNAAPPNEPMVESCDAKENASCQSMAEDSLSDSKTSYVLAHDDPLLSEEDDNPNNLSFDDDNIFGFDLLSSVDGMNDDRQSLETPAVHLSADIVKHTPPTMIYQDEDQNPPTAEDDVKFTDLEVATLGLMQLCNVMTLVPIVDSLMTSWHFSVGFTRKRLISPRQRAVHHF